jgi:hypothetical protein
VILESQQEVYFYRIKPSHPRKGHPATFSIQGVDSRRKVVMTINSFANRELAHAWAKSHNIHLEEG